MSSTQRTTRVPGSGFRIQAPTHGELNRAATVRERARAVQPLAHGRGSVHARRAMLLVAVLVIITVLALLGASFSYLMNAQLASVKASQDQQQAYYAAMTGVDRTIELLRSGRVLQDNWYNNPREFRRIPLIMPAQREEDVKGGSTSLADQEPIPGMSLWRWSIVATEIPKDDTERSKIRYGLTDEASKVNLNVATRSQLIAIFDLIRHDNITSAALADALIDWRDADDEAQAEGAESAYYLKLKPAYRCKNGPLASVEELLQIKGFNGRIVYGEDYNRNGYLDNNENDGEEGTFPPDDGDGKLDRGLLPFVTIYSWDWNRSNDNKNRVDINTVSFASASTTGAQNGAGQQDGNAQDPGLGALAALVNRVPTQVTEEIRPEVIDFIADAQKQGYRFKSIGDLVGLVVYSGGKSNHDDLWQQYAKDYRQAERRHDDETVQDQAEELAGQDGEDDNPNQGSGNQTGGGSGNNSQNTAPKDWRDDNKNGDNQGNNSNRQPGSNNSSNTGGGKNDARKMQSLRQDDPNNAPNNTPNNAPQNQPGRGRGRGRGAGPRSDRPDSSNNDDGSTDQDRNPRGPRNGPKSPQGGPGNGPPNDGSGPGDGRGPGRGPVDNPGGNNDPGRGTRGGGGGGFGGNRGGNPGGNNGGNSGRTLTSPVDVSDLPALCDRLTVWNSPVVSGLINVNTAPVQVLRTIPGLTAEEADAIVEKRQGLQGIDKLTPAWLVTSGAISPETFALISNLVTTRSIQFTIDAIGFNDTVGTVKRVQAVVEMRGELATVKYLRDITSLGIGFPVWDDQRSEGFAFTDR